MSHNDGRVSLLDNLLTSTDDQMRRKEVSPDPAHPASPRWALCCSGVRAVPLRHFLIGLAIGTAIAVPAWVFVMWIIVTAGSA